MDGGSPGIMECRNCEEMQRRFVCENCLRGHLRTHRQRIKAIADARDKYVAAATQALGPLNEKRLRRATVAELERNVQRHRGNEKRIRTDVQTMNEDIRKRRAALLERREALTQLYAQFPHLSNGASSTSTLTPSTANTKEPSSPYKPGRRSSQAGSSQAVAENPIDIINAAIATLKVQHAQLTKDITEARQMLVQELVDVFHIVEVGGRPALNLGSGVGRPVDGHAARGKRGEWEIAGRLMCVPGDVGRYPPLHINAAITHTLHFLHLLTYYLGVKLPFEVIWSTLPNGGPSQASGADDRIASSPSTSKPISSSSGSRFRYGNLGGETGDGVSRSDGSGRTNFKRGVGTPWIFAGKGGESGGWARWTTRNPLYLPVSSGSGQGSSTSSQTVVHRIPVSSDPRPSSPASVGSTPSRTPYPPARQSSPTTVEGIRTRTTSSSGTPSPTPPSSHRTVSAPTTPTSLNSGSGLNFGLGLGMLRPYLGIVGGKKDQSPVGLSDTTRRQSLSNASTGDADSDGGSTRDIGGRKKRSRDEVAASFTTGLAMLLYNVSYLAHTQGVDIPLAQAGEVLRNLWAICCSPELGRHSHETHPLLPHPTPSTFPIDFMQLLQATAADPISRAKARRRISGDSGGVTAGIGVTGTSQRKGQRQVGREGVIVEEDEWDLIDDTSQPF